VNTVLQYGRIAVIWWSLVEKAAIHWVEVALKRQAKNIMYLRSELLRQARRRESSDGSSYHGWHGWHGYGSMKIRDIRVIRGE